MFASFSLKNRCWLGAALAIALVGSAQADTERETDTPRLIQVTTHPGTDQLPDDGGSYCVPTATTMDLYYLTTQGYSRLSPGWDPANPGSLDLNAAYNLDKVIAGLIYTSPYQGTSPGNWQDGVNLYLGLMGYAGLSSVSVTSTPTFSQITDSIASPDEATVLLLHWYYADGHVQGGHGTALVGTDDATQTLTIHNPEPASTIAGKADIPANAQQTFATEPAPSGTLPAGVYIVTPDNPLQRYGQAGDLLNIQMNSAAKTAGPQDFALSGTTVIGTNGGNLTAWAPLVDGTSAGGIDKESEGTLTLAGANTTTGDNVVGGGTLASTLSSGSSTSTPFGSGNMTVGGGAVLAFQPSGSSSIVALAVASGSGKSFVVQNGLATLSVVPGANAQVAVTLGGATDGSTKNLRFLNPGQDALLINPGTSLAALGSTVTIKVNGSAGNLPTLIDGKMVSPSYVAQDTNGSLAFLTYSETNGFVTASTLNQNSFTGANDAILQTTSAFSVTGTANSALALQANADIGGAGTITLGQAGDHAGLILNNGANLSVDQVNFLGSAFIYANGTSTISSAISSPGSLALAETGSGVLSLTSAVNVQTYVNSGTVRMNGGSGPVNVNRGATLAVTGTASGSVSVAAGGELHLENSRLTGPLHLTASSTAFSDTWTPGGVLSGTGTVQLSDSHAVLQGIIGSSSQTSDLTFDNSVSNADITIKAPLMFTLAALTSSDTGGDAGADWSSITFQGSVAMLLGRDTGNNKQAIDVELNFADAGLVPNASESFWETDHTWQFLELGPNITVSPDVTWTVSNQNIFSFSDLGTFSFGSDGVLTWVAIPEPSTMVLFATGGLALAGLAVRKRRNQ